MRNDDERLDFLTKVYDTLSIQQSILYANSRTRVDTLSEALRKDGHSVSSIHSGLERSERARVMKEFRAGATRVLVSSDLLGRGIDIPTVSLVVNVVRAGLGTTAGLRCSEAALLRAGAVFPMQALCSLHWRTRCCPARRCGRLRLRLALFSTRLPPYLIPLLPFPPLPPCPALPLQDVPAGDRLCEAYLHRIGRSTRLARKGVAITFITAGKREDEAAMSSIEEFYHIAVPELPDAGIPREDLRNAGEAF